MSRLGVVLGMLVHHAALTVMLRFGVDAGPRRAQPLPDAGLVNRSERLTRNRSVARQATAA
jgi:hypothetical protein